MKRISMSTACSQTQTFSYPLIHRQKQNDFSISLRQQQETLRGSEKPREQENFCRLVSFQNQIFRTCYKNNDKDKVTEDKNSYHKLRYQSMNENQKKFTKNSKESIKNQTKIQTTKNSSCEQNNFIHTGLNEKLDFGFQNSKPFSFVDSYMRTKIYSPEQKTNSFEKIFRNLYSQHQLSQNQTDLKRQQKRTIYVKQGEKIDNKKRNNRLSTLDSYRFKSNLQETVVSRSSEQFLIVADELEKVSKLCQSVKVQLKYSQEKIPLRSQKIIKNKSFIRSLKDSNKNKQKQTNQNLLIRPELIVDGKQNLNQQKLFQVQQNDKRIKIPSMNNVQIQKNQSYLNRIKTLAECGNTIISRYNMSSQKKSRLSESSIIFQASKDFKDIDSKDNKKLPKRLQKDQVIVSDGQIAIKKGNNKIKQSRFHRSLSERNNGLLYLQSSEQINSFKNNKAGINKVNRKNFIRSQKRSVPLKKDSQNQELEEIRFDLNTFIEYGPL